MFSLLFSSLLSFTIAFSLYEEANMQFRKNGRLERELELSKEAKSFFKNIRSDIDSTYNPLAINHNTNNKPVIIHHLVNPLNPEEFKLYARNLDEGQSIPSGKPYALPYWILASDNFNLKFRALDYEGKVNVQIYIGATVVWEGESKCPIANGPYGVNLNKVVMQEEGILRWGFVTWTQRENYVSCMETADIDLRKHIVESRLAKIVRH
jgi:hypothetical protein